MECSELCNTLVTRGGVEECAYISRNIFLPGSNCTGTELHAKLSSSRVDAPLSEVNARLLTLMRVRWEALELRRLWVGAILGEVFSCLRRLL